ncbi:MAG: polysaccharide biosynthesis tyrosine autokinase [Microthrixaceae bacterium]
MTQPDPSSDLRRSLRLIRRRLAWILVPAIIAGVATYVLSGLRSEQYRAETDVRVVDPSAGTVLEGPASSGNSLREVTTQVEVAGSPTVRAAADERMGPETASRVGSIEVAPVVDSDLIRITATASTAEAAAAAANALAESFTTARAGEITAAYTETAEEYRIKAQELKEQIDLTTLALADVAPDSPDADRLRDDRADLEDQAREFAASAREYELEATLRSEAITVVNPATVPPGPFAPAPLRDAVLAALLTALAAIAVVFLADRLDQRVRTSEDLDRMDDPPPLIGIVPDLRQRTGRRRPATDPDAIVIAGSPQAEAFRKLRSSVWQQSLRGDVSSVLVTSAQPSEGKSLVSANLAVSLALSGVRVALVSADLRAPRVGSFFQVDETEPGLTDVLAGTADLESVIRTISVGEATLSLLPAGPAPFDPGVLLGSDVMREVITSIESAGAELVVLDSAPIGPVGDTIDLARNVDAAIVVVRSRSARIDQVEQAVSDVRDTQTPVVGLVLNGVSGADDGYGYGAGKYGYGYGATGTARAATN